MTQPLRRVGEGVNRCLFKYGLINKSLGNAVLPQLVEILGKTIMEVERLSAKTK